MTMSMMNLLAAAHPGFLMPVRASKIADEIDPLAWYIHGVTIFFTVLIVGLTCYFAWKYRASAYPVADPPGHNNLLEVTWTVLPSIIIFVMFFWGFRVFIRMTESKPAALQVDAIGQMWQWAFQYRNPLGGPDVKSKELYVPIGTPVEVTLRSNDVIHALYLPAMRVKKDVVPGRFNKLNFEATKLGDFSIYCAEYCGDLHSRMLSVVHVVSADEYRDKLIKLSDPTKNPDTGEKLPPIEAGKNIVTLNGCFSCHSAEGKNGVGPTWKDMFGGQAELADGQSVLVDDAYVLESIRNPNAKVVKGFGPPSAMNAFAAAQLPDEHVRYIIAYMKSISVHAPHDAASPLAPASQPVGQPPGVSNNPTTVPH